MTVSNRAYSCLEVKAFNDVDRTIEGIASTPIVDRVGDSVNPMGAVFSVPMPLLLDHDSRSQVGHVEFAKATKNGIPFKARIVKIDEAGEVKDLVDKAWHLVKSRLRSFVSIGFRPLKGGVEPLEDGGIHFKSWEWLELSLVSIPANSGAVIFEAKSLDAALSEIKSIDTELLAASGHKQSDDDRREEKPGASGKQKQPNPRKGVKIMAQKTVVEQISAFEATRQAKAARMTEIMEASAEKGETLDAEQTEEYDGLSVEVKSIDEHLVRLADLEKSNKAAAKPVVDVKDVKSGSDARGGVVTAMKDNLPPGIEFARYAMCLMSAKGNTSQALEIAKARYPDQPRIQTTLKAAVAGGTTTDATWAAPLVDYQQFAGDFVEFLRPQTIIGKFGTGGIPSLRRVPFNIQIPTQTSGGAAYWVGEGAPKPLTKFDFDRITMRWAKVANIAVLTEELVRFSNPSAEEWVRDALAKALVERIDIDFIDPAKTASANISPASITNGITAIPSVGPTADNIREDVQNIFGAFIAANLTPANGVWIMNSRTALGVSLMRNALGQDEFPGITMMGGTFVGLPVVVSQYVADGLVILVNASDIYLADDGQVVIDASREASLQMLDNPTNNSATGTATSMVSMFQTNSIALRAERFINWQRRRTAAVQYLEDVAWGGSGLSGT